jgi:hypothetical protein
MLVLGQAADHHRKRARDTMVHRRYSSRSRKTKRTPTASVRTSVKPAPSSSARVRSSPAMLKTPDAPGSGGGRCPRSMRNRALIEAPRVPLRCAPALLTHDRCGGEPRVAGPGSQLQHHLARPRREPGQQPPTHGGERLRQLGAPALPARRHRLPDFLAGAAVALERHTGDPSPGGGCGTRGSSARLLPAEEAHRQEHAPDRPGAHDRRRGGGVA